MNNQSNLEIFRNASHMRTENARIENFFHLACQTRNYYQTKPGNLQHSTKDTSEKALQRALFFDTNKLFNENFMHVIEMELPIIPAKPKEGRRPCFDLIGKKINLDEYHLIEIKFSKNNNYSNSPILALAELIFYKYSILKYKSLFHKNNVYHTEQKNFWNEVNEDNIKIVILANEKYWDYWRNHKVGFDKFKQIYEKLLRFDIPEFTSVSNIDFKEQQIVKNTSYSPSLPPDFHWKLIKFV